MPDEIQPCFLRALSVQGFRAYLDPKTFDFASKRSLAVFAPNGSGKSSIVDAVEFMFSDSGTLDRLGLRAIHNSAGPSALIHNLADDRKIAPQVAMTFRKGTTETQGTRSATGQRERPAAATAVWAGFAVNPIIRGHSLRRFVEEQKAEERYGEVAKWLQLTPLVMVQKNLRALRVQIKAAAEDTAATKANDASVASATAGAVKAWNAADVLTYINEAVLQPLDDTLTLANLDKTDPGFVTIEERAKAEEKQHGLPSLRQARDQILSVYAQEPDPEGGALVRTGALATYEAAIEALDNAEATEADERSKAASAIFAAVWDAAEPLFAEGQPEIDVCPVCETPIAATAAGSADEISAHIAAHKAELVAYSDAKAALVTAKASATSAQQRMILRLEQLPDWLTDAHPDLNLAMNGYLPLLKAEPSKAPDSTDLVAALLNAQAGLVATIDDIEQRQGEHTYVKARDKIITVMALRDAHDLALKTTQELEKLHVSLNAQTASVSNAIREKVQALLDSLRTPTNEIYAAIQGDAAIPIRLDLPPEDDTNQQRLNLLIDFAANRAGVQPSGFLSDSQIHTLALALRLAAIEQFNAHCPLIVLDDIVTSYDADHRRLISGLLASRFAGAQILITTHDERFFIYLKDQTHSSDWEYQRITRLDRDYGPRFAQHMVSDGEIEKRWAEGESAANEIRQAEEEWLLAKGQEFAVKVHIRAVEKGHSYERYELAEALATFLKGAGLEPTKVDGVANRFLESLKAGVVENFGSHFQLAQYGNGSIGDEKARWKEFTAFRDQFSCGKCKRKKFKRPLTMSKPVCAHGGCEAQLEFAPAAAENAA